MINLEFYNNFQLENRFRQKEEKKSIRLMSGLAALGVAGYLMINFMMSFPLILMPAVSDLYMNDPTFQSVVTIFLSVFGMLIPFGLCGFYLEKRTGREVYKFNKPVSVPLMITAVFLGFFVCLVGNYVTSLFVEAMSSIGITLTAPELATPEDLPGRIIYAVAIAVVPALVEEFAIRGAVMQPLRRHGDWFAIVASAIVFGVLHGNLIQAPFALIAGIGIGYAVCVTESMWTGVIIHFCNNLYAVVTEFMIADIPDEERLNTVYYIVMVVLYAVSIAGTVAFVVIRNNCRLLRPASALSGGQKMAAFIFSLPMIAALAVMLAMTAQYVDASALFEKIKDVF